MEEPQALKKTIEIRAMTSYLAGPKTSEIFCAMTVRQQFLFCDSACVPRAIAVHWIISQKIIFCSET